MTTTDDKNQPSAPRTTEPVKRIDELRFLPKADPLCGFEAYSGPGNTDIAIFIPKRCEKPKPEPEEPKACKTVMTIGDQTKCMDPIRPSDKQFPILADSMPSTPPDEKPRVRPVPLGGAYPVADVKEPKLMPFTQTAMSNLDDQKIVR